MKMTTALILAACLQVSARGYGQKISLDFTNSTLEKVFREIENQSGYLFIYSDAALEKTSPLTIHINAATIDEALHACLKDQPLVYELTDKSVIIKEKPLPVRSLITITGVVLSEADEPLEGVTIRVKNSGKGAISNAKGEFLLRDIPDDAVLVISSIGFSQEEINTNGKTKISLHLKLAVKGLDNTIVVAYGTTSTRFNTGNISKVNSEEIKNQPVSNPLQALQGQVPGIFVTQTSGIPGSRFDVLIRGQNSISQGNDPFYIVDGVPFTSTSMINAGQTIITGGSPLNYLNISDIESIEILKDADALAIYGSRGANGAILITTKKGKIGQTKVDIDFYNGIGQVGKKMDLLSTRQYLDMRYEAFRNDGEDWRLPDYSANDLKIWDTTRYTDWQKKLLGGTAHITSAQASISGGDINTQFLFGGGYYKETTVFPGDFSDQKGSLHFNINHASENKRFKALLTGNFVVEQNSLPRTDLTPSALTLSPDAPPVYGDDGKLNWAGNTWSNPYSAILQRYHADVTNLVVNSTLNYRLADGLQVKTNLGYTTTHADEKNLTPSTSVNPFGGVTTGMADFSTTNYKSWVVEPQVEYFTKIAEGKLNALLGGTFQQNNRDGNLINATGYTNDALLGDLKSALAFSVVNTTYSKYKYQAFFARINYEWDGKYIVNITGRRDGSSRFGPARQFANFGAVGAAWVFSEEKFIKNEIRILSFAKLRASYGTTGNDQIGDYQFYDLWTPTTWTYLNSRGIYANRLFNSAFAWELNKKFETSLDLGFLKNRIYVSVTFYRNRSGNQLVGYPLPGTTGFSQILANLPAIVENSGIELDVRSTNIKTAHFSWSSGFNISIPRNRLVAYPGLDQSPFYQTYEIGKSLNGSYTYDFSGVNTQTGIYEFKSLHGDYTSSPDYNTDRTKWVDLSKKFYGGLQNSFRLYGFQLDILIQFVKQRGLNYIGVFDAPGRLSNQPGKVLNQWQQIGDNKPIQQFTQDYTSAYTSYFFLGYSNNVYTDASFIRLKNLAMSYDLPNNWLNKAHIKSARIYVHAQNMITLTGYPGIDPESGQNSLPPLKVIVAGFQLTL